MPARFVVFLVALTGAVAAQEEPKPDAKRPGLGSPDSVDVRLEEDATKHAGLFNVNILEPYEAFKKRLYDEIGLQLGGDYSAFWGSATKSPGKNSAAGGIFRFYGKWDLTGRGTADTGGMIYKVEHRHDYTSVPPSGLASQAGYVGLFAPPFSDQGWRLTNLYWRQSVLENRLVVYAGFLDATDFVDVHALASPWTGFVNFAFSTGSATMGLPNDATLGAMVGFWLNDSFYVIGSLADANADPTNAFDGFETLVDEFETFKSIEFGWTPSREQFFLSQAHVTVWHVDDRKDAGTPDGWGINGSITGWLGERWMPFIRGGYAHDGGSLLGSSVSVGIGYQRERGGDVFAVAANWGKPNHDTFGGSLDEQYTAEAFYRWRITNNFEIIPSVQLLGDPALNPDDNVVGVFSVRARLVF